ncbi:unnamed protein product, partial [Rotaria socialis]
ALISSTTQTLLEKDISLDSLDGTDSPQPKDQTITSSSSSPSDSNKLFSSSSLSSRAIRI